MSEINTLDELCRKMLSLAVYAEGTAEMKASEIKERLLPFFGQEVIDRAVAAITGGEPVSRWKPIATAPKDGTEVLVWNGKTVIAASWGCSLDGDYNNPTWEPSHTGTLWADSATHWMPMPDSPNAG